jgi:hypothetical protein
MNQTDIKYDHLIHICSVARYTREHKIRNHISRGQEWMIVCLKEAGCYVLSGEIASGSPKPGSPQWRSQTQNFPRQVNSRIKSLSFRLGVGCRVKHCCVETPVEESGTQQKHTGVIGGRNLWTPWPGNGLKSRRMEGRKNISMT